ncbi:MAG: inositol monophosphatase family protein [Caldisericia bacterium]
MTWSQRSTSIPGNDCGIDSKEFPNDKILAEEEFTKTDIGEGWSWIIDPLDGTTITLMVSQCSVFQSNLSSIEPKLALFMHHFLMSCSAKKGSWCISQ